LAVTIYAKLELSQNDDGQISFQFTNTGEERLCIHPQSLPDNEGLRFVEIQNLSTNETAGYLGIISKIRYVFEDFKCLMPGETLGGVLRLDEGYQLSAGVYRVQYIGGFIYSVDEESMIDTFEVESNEIVYVAKEINFSLERFHGLGCNANQRTTVNNALNEFIRLRQTAANNVNNRNTAAYRGFFGATNDGQHNFVRRIITNINGVPRNSINPICGGPSCSPNTFAYVMTAFHYDIYLCQMFWRSPVRGYDTIGGTLIHEMSHFDVIGRTDDIVYGVNPARDLARRNPAQAVRNADNYQFYTETLLYN